jgi:hypothetical protein
MSVIAQNIEEQHLKMAIEDVLNEGGDNESGELVNIDSDDGNYSLENEENTGQHHLCRNEILFASVCKCT